MTQQSTTNNVTPAYKDSDCQDKGAFHNSSDPDDLLSCFEFDRQYGLRLEDWCPVCLRERERRALNKKNASTRVSNKRAAQAARESPEQTPEREVS